MAWVSSKKEKSGLLLLLTLLKSHYHLASILFQLRCTMGKCHFGGREGGVRRRGSCQLSEVVPTQTSSGRSHHIMFAQTSPPSSVPRDGLVSSQELMGAPRMALVFGSQRHLSQLNPVQAIGGGRGNARGGRSFQMLSFELPDWILFDFKLLGRVWYMLDI